MSDVSEHSEFDYPKKKRKKGKAWWSYNKMPWSWRTDLAVLGPYAMTSG